MKRLSEYILASYKVLKVSIIYSYLVRSRAAIYIIPTKMYCLELLEGSCVFTASIWDLPLQFYVTYFFIVKYVFFKNVGTMIC